MNREEAPLTFRQRLAAHLIAWAGWGLVAVIGLTVRFDPRTPDRLAEARSKGGPAILSFWHNQIISGILRFRNQGIVVITSRHFDGEYIARIIRRFGFGTARGSSTRGGTRALLELLRCLRTGRDVAFTIDGPRGPIYTVKGGPLFLARKSGCPLIPFHLEPERYWELGSWDRFRIPKPFSRIAVWFGDPVDPGEGAEVSEEDIGRFQGAMDSLRLSAGSSFRRSPQGMALPE